MNAKTAVARRIQALCAERDIAVNMPANQSGVASSTIYSMLNEKSQDSGVVFIQKICDELDISVRTFLTIRCLKIWSRKYNKPAAFHRK